MATPKEKPAEAEAAQEEKAAAQAEASQPSGGDFPVERLITEASDLLGVPSYVAAGVFSGEEGSMGLEDAKAKVEQWLASPAHEAPEEA